MSHDVKAHRHLTPTERAALSGVKPPCKFCEAVRRLFGMRSLSDAPPGQPVHPYRGMAAELSEDDKRLMRRLYRDSVRESGSVEGEDGAPPTLRLVKQNFRCPACGEAFQDYGVSLYGRCPKCEKAYLDQFGGGSRRRGATRP